MAKNCILLTIDSLRADHAAEPTDLMPRINEYADDGVRFTRAYSNGYSTPISFPTILTGTYPDQYGGHGYMSEERPFIAKKFQDAGFETAGFHTNPHLREDKNYDTGFDTYNDFDDEAGDLSRLRYLVTQNLDSDSKLYKLLKRAYHFVRTTSGSTDYTEAPKLNQKALNWLDTEYDGENPFFLWTHYMDVHYPFYPPDAYLSDRSISNKRAISVNGKMHEEDAEITDEDTADLQALYRGEVRYMDHYLGELLDGLKERGLYEDTVFIVTSDHGELFGEHGLFGHPPSGYEESFHVPLLLFGPGIPDGEEIDTMTTLVDLPPTVADLFDLEMDANWEGESLVPYIQGEKETRETLALLGNQSIPICQSENYRLVWWREEPSPESPETEWELRRISDTELLSIDQYEDDVEPLRAKLEEFVQSVEDESQLAEPAVDETTEDRLEALGYK